MPTVLPSRYLVSQTERSSIRRSRSVQRVGERPQGGIGRINLAELERCPFAHNGLVGGSSPPGPTTQSGDLRHFPEGCELCAIGGIARGRLVSAMARFGLTSPFLRIRLWPQNPVSRQQRPPCAETRFECGATAGEGQASRTDVTIPQACRRGEPHPIRGAAGPRWPP
jgi:hypothetical protein